MNSSVQKALRIGDIDVTLTRKAVKNINLRVSRRNGNVSVSAPRYIPETFVLGFLYAKRAWIKERVNASKNAFSDSHAAYQSGDAIPFLGKDYTLNIIETTRRELKVEGNTIHLWVRREDLPEHYEKQLQAWYRRELKNRLPDLVQHWSDMLGVTVDEFRIKKMKTKWGTCNITDRRIWINLELIKYPTKCLEYVVLHELTHLIERGHNARFYGIIEQHMDNWREVEALLNSR